jgi:putative NADH-flavin reductase
MKIAVIGGTGMVGSRIVAEAAARGHQVTAVSRRGDASESPNVTALKADASDLVALNNLAAASLEALKTLTTAAEWTYLSPAPVIAPGDRTGKYLVAEDFAVAIMDEAETPAQTGRRFTVAN